MIGAILQETSYGPLVWALSFLKGSELWATILKVVYNGVIVGLQGFRIRCPY